MKIKSRNIKAHSVISLEDDKGPFGEIAIKKLTQKEIVDLISQRSDAESGDAASDLYHSSVCASITKIEGLMEGGEAVTVEKLKSRDIYPETLKLIYECFNAVLAGKEVDEKKEQPGDLSSALDGCSTDQI